MLSPLLRHVAISLTLVTFAGLFAPSHAQTSNDLFNEGAGLTLQITIH